ncbi:hypothetical protein PYH37_000650 [Sinorhizobium numidicum]|uniref:Uncharacterized protein n=1 Tax=Sinorhizobium numidicum TaxID=680248 RepID=A0ABY8CRH8_9HYPH|nr:hypothetical protein [Sinorhizobium numidicum]WEX75263.1 hypothetical protein PYH37_000650 [Sinorhizobium numidicum]WEX81258.1 hypothetical protein PYH38_000652 [Sinorhizobium numidicum]
MRLASIHLFPSVEKCVEALADTLVSLERPDSDEQENLEAIAAFLQTILTKMPDHLGIPFRILTLIFDAWPLAATGKPFHALDLARRIDQVDRWEHSRLAFRRTLIAFYRPFTIFAFYSELCKQDVLVGAHTKQN